MTKPSMLLIAEKRDMRVKYENAYEHAKDQIPFKMYFAELRGHVDQIKENKDDWNEHQFVLPQGFLNWQFDSHAINQPQNSPYEIRADAQNYLDTILKILNENQIDYLGIGTDGDIEGSTLASAFLSLLPVKYQELPRLRLFLDDPSEKTIIHGMQHMYHLDDKMLNGEVTYNRFKNSGILRNQLNYVAGISLTRALRVRAGHNIKANFGLVKAPILEMVNARYEQFCHFTPQTFYYLGGEVALPKGNLPVTLYELAEQQRYTSNAKDDLEHFLKTCSTQVTLKQLQIKEQTTSAPQFYRLTQLQGVLNDKYGMKLDHSLAILEDLYNNAQLITYPRTESNVLASAQVKDFENIIRMCQCIPKLKGFAQQALMLNRLEEVAKDKRFVNDKKVNAHPAITFNTHTHHDFKWEDLSTEQQQVLYEIGCNTLAPFLAPKKTSIATALFDNQPPLSSLAWYAKESTVLDKGWTAITNHDKIQPSLLAPLKDHLGQAFTMQSSLKTGQTKPMPLYTVKSLMDNLDNLNHTDQLLNEKDDKKILKEFHGIGTSATRGHILEQLEVNQILTITDKADKAKNIGKGKLIPTEIGVAFAQLLNNMNLLQLTEIVDIETDLIAIQNGTLTPQEFQQKYFAQIEQQVKQIQQSAESDWQKISVTAQNTDKTLVGTCPLCQQPVYAGKKMVICSQSHVKFVNAQNEPVKKDDPTGHWVLEGCPLRFSFHPFHSKEKITKGDIQRLLSLQPTKKAYTLHSAKKDKDYQLPLIWDQTKQHLMPYIAPAQEIGTCPLCHGKLMMDSKFITCENDDVKLYRQPFHALAPLTKTQVQTILQGKPVTMQFHSVKKNKDYSAELSFNQDNDGKAEWCLQLPQHQRQTIGQCFLCQSEVIMQDDNYIYCNNHDCPLRFTRQPFHAKTPLTMTDIQALIGGKATTMLQLFSTKKNCFYSAKLYWNTDNSRLQCKFN